MKALILFSLLWAGHSFANERFIEKTYFCDRLNQSSLQLADDLESEYMENSQNPSQVQIVFARIDERKAMLDEFCQGYASEARLRLEELEDLIFSAGYRKI